MIAHIDSNDGPRFREPFGDHPPIACRPEKPMRNQQRNGVGAIMKNRVQHASFVTLCRAQAPEGLSGRAKITNSRRMGNHLQDSIDEIRALMESHLRIKGRDLRAQTRRAGRLLSRKVRRDVNYLIQAEELQKNPKLARMVDDSKVTKARTNIVAFLQTIDPREQMWTRIINIAASVALGLIAIFVVVLYVLVQRGFV